MKKLGTRGMIIGALLIAISVVLARLTGFMLPGGAIRISFTNVPIILSGMILGPVGGLIVGGLSDFIGAMLLPQGAYFIGFTISSALTGLIPALVIRSSKDFTLTKIFIANLIIFVVISVVMNTYWLTLMLDKGFLALLPGRLISSGVLTCTNTFFVYVVSKRLKI